MPAHGREAQRAERRHGAVEAPALLVEEGRLRVVGGREMRVDRLDRQMPARKQLGDRATEIVVAEAEAIHAGVDLEMTAEPHGRTGGGRFERARRGRRRDGRRQPVREDAAEIADTERAEHEDRNRHTRVAQEHALFDVRAGEHRRAGGFERGTDARGAVAVGVGFDDGNNSRGSRGFLGVPRGSLRFSGSGFACEETCEWREGSTESRRG